MTRKQSRELRQRLRDLRYRPLGLSEVPPAALDETTEQEDDSDLFLVRSVVIFSGVKDRMILLSYYDADMIRDASVNIIAFRKDRTIESAREQFVSQPPNRRKWPARPYGLRAGNP